jgi:fumarate reductase (CoM/CoB) subunit B
MQAGAGPGSVINQIRVANVKIYRFDPDDDRSPRYDEFRVEIQGVTKVLELLNLIYRKFDPTLAYRSSCRSGKCGVCSVMVNRRAVLACRENVPEHGEVIIEPLANYPVIRDLIVDRREYDQRTRELASSTSVGELPQKWSSSDAEPYDRLANCIECLVCDASCPVLAISREDYGGPALFRQEAFLGSDHRVRQSCLSPSERLHLEFCSTCKACSASCPKEVEVFDEAIRSLRRRKTFQDNLPDLQKDYAQVIQKTGSLFTPYRVPLPEQLPAVIDPEIVREEVIFFPGCMMNMRFQGAGKALIHVLKSIGVRVHLPREMICCGGPLLWTGQDEAFREIRSKNIRAFERVNVQRLVVACAGCGMTLKKEYGQTSSRDVLSQFLIYDFTEYLEYLKPAYEFRREKKRRVTYHDPCHLRRGQGIWDEPRRLLKALPDVEFVELRDSDRCCGGMLGTVSRDLSNALSKKKAEAIIETGVDAVVTECPFCKDMISKALKKEEKRIPVLMVAELIEGLYGEKPESPLSHG